MNGSATLELVKKVKRLFIVIFAVVVLLIFGTIIFFVFKPKVAGIFVDTIPSSIVYMNGQEVGSTPFKVTQAPGEVVLKLVPKDGGLLPYETKVPLLSGVQTVVRYTFGSSQNTGSGEIISFEKIAKGETSLAVVSIPDSAEITIDDTIKVFAPYKTSAIQKGDHTLVVRAKGYQDRTIRVKTNEGYKLTAVVTLAKSENSIASLQSPTPTPSPTPIQTTEKVLILNTATGKLRVRKEPKTGSEEIGEVRAGEEYPFLERDPVTGWFKIIYSEGNEGWVSSQYARIAGSKPTSINTPTPTVSVTTPG